MNFEWYKNIYNMIKYFSDINTLSDAWYGFDKENASYLGEDSNILFDDLSFDDFIEDIEGKNIKNELLKSIIDFRNLLFNYKEPQSGLAIDILNDSEFTKIVDKAKQVINLWDMYPIEKSL
jgi:hypothetical protein